MPASQERAVVDIENFRKTLKERVKGLVLTDDLSLGIYSTDASMYQITPIVVVVPLDEEDVIQAVQIAGEFGISILPRGGGTSLAGQTVGESMVIDFSKRMNRILQLNVEERWIRVQPGIIRDELNAELAQHGLYFPIDPSTGNRANIGGMIGTDASGTRSILYGKTVDHVLETRILLADGYILNLQNLSSEEYEKKCSSDDPEGKLLSRFKEIIESNREEIIKRYPTASRRVCGYNLDEFIDSRDWNLAKLIVGSEGTLATLLEAKLKLSPLPRRTGLCIVHFNDLIEAIQSVKGILNYDPSAVEILDEKIATLVVKNPTLARMADFMVGEPKALLIVEFQGQSTAEVHDKIARLVHDLKSKAVGYAYPERYDPTEQARVWQVRKDGLGIMQNVPGDRKPTPFIEDASVPLDALPEYITEVKNICEKYQTETSLYAHASVGVIHVRPLLDLRQQVDIDRMKAIAEEAFNLVVKCGGAWSAEHGDGLARSPFMERYFGPQIYSVFREVKALFDPENRMNPGKIVEAPPMDHHLRYGPDYQPQAWDTVYHYRSHRSFTAEVELCSGIGTCQKTLQGTMCPSYIATRDEEHSTRGRANALRLAMSGQLGSDGLTSKRLFEAMELCLSCKACKSECPSNVDMAKLKSEFLQHYHDKHGIPLRDRLVAASSDMAPLFSGWPAPVANWFMGTMLFRKVLEWVAGFDSRRKLPRYTSETFYKWFNRRNNSAMKSSKKVVLYDDTYMTNNEPRVGKAAVELLESCGYEVLLARSGDCQRPRISHGFLKEAKRRGEKTLKALDAFIQQGLQIVVCEPSCASALTDDLPDLIDDAALAERITKNVTMIDVFLDREVRCGNLKCNFTSPYREIFIHGHCHQESLYGNEAMKSLLSQVPGLTVKEIDSGCCGMAGSFGHEKEHYDLSMKIGENRLFKTIREMSQDAVLIACGFSCRHQIADGTGVQALHWVETIRGK